MKKVKHIISTITFTVFLILSLTIDAQNLVVSGAEQTVSYNGTYQDFTIPNDLDLSQFNALSFTMRGGDGGRRRIQGVCSVAGGRGATVEAKFAITPSGQTLRKGGTIRFIVGQKGNNVLGSNVEAAGGGGGTAILYRPPGVSGNGTCTSGGLSSPTDGFDEDCWIILAVAGGGGGAYSAGGCAGESEGKGGNDATNGSDGKGSDSGNGGQDGRAGFTSDFLILSGGGGGWDPSKPAGTDNAAGEQGRFEGGDGFSGQNNLFNKGGFGYGGGGGGGETSVNAVGGGGGGGFSGGGAGGSYKGGGGGGSFLNAIALDDSNISPGGTSATPDNGVITYRFQYRQNLLPTVECLPFPIIAQVSTSQNFTLSTSDVESSSSFGCGNTLTKSLSQSVFTCSDLGPNTVTLTVEDECGNMASCNYSFNVTELNEALNLTCPADVNVDINPPNCTASLSGELQPNYGGACGSTITYQLSEGGSVLQNGTGVLNSYDFAPGTYTLSYQNTNANNTNTLDCSFTINIADGGGAFGPTAMCKDVTAVLDGNCTVTVPITEFDNGSFDNCSDISLSVTYQDCSGFLCVEVNSNTSVSLSEPDVLDITLRATNTQGDVGTCTATLTAVDNTTPNAVCKNATINLNAQGTANLNLNQIHGASTDNCSVVTPVSASQTSFDCADVNTTHTVELTVEDGSGNQSTCMAEITVVDNIAPIVECEDKNYVLQWQNGVLQNAGLPSEWVLTNATDNCGISLIGGGNIITLDCSDVGNTISQTVSKTDVNGNSSSCTANVTIIDNTPPQAICKNTSISLDADGIATLTVDHIDNNSSDECGIESRSLDQMSFDCTQQGGHTVTLAITDVNGNQSSCTATVTVEDDLAPNAVCQDLTVYLSNPVIQASQLAGGSTDNCTTTEDLSLIIFFGSSISGPTTTFGCESVGVNDNYSVDVFDEAGNLASCDVTITVVDDIAPTAICQNTSVALNDQGQASISLAEIHGTSTDNCGGVVNPISASQLSFDCAHVGNQSVILTVGDENGNQSTCTAMVTIEDNTPPVLECEDKIYVLEWFDGILTNEVIPFDYIQTSVSDNCGLIGVVVNSPIFVDCNDAGNTIQQTLTRIDVNNNSTSCTANITIVDNKAPQAKCKDATIMLDGNGMVILTTSQINNGSTDECGIASMSIDGNTVFDCDDLGMISATLTIADPSGNTASCQSIVTIEEGDNLPVGWTGTDIGQVTIGNEYSYEACSAVPVFSVIGSGNNTMGMHGDNVAFIHQSLCGDGMITAKLESIEPNGYGGLMVRENTGAGAKQVAIFSNLSSIYRHEARYTPNGLKQVNSFFKPQASWLRLQRQGDWVFAYYSLDGNNFQYIHGVYMPMQSCVEIGMASFTYLPNAQTEAVFSNVSVSGNNGTLGIEEKQEEMVKANQFVEETTTSPYHHITTSLSTRLFPNPAADHFILTFDQPIEHTTNIQLFNAFGLKVGEQRIDVGAVRVEWQVRSLPAGVYWIRDQRNQLNRQLIITKE